MLRRKRKRKVKFVEEGRGIIYEGCFLGKLEGK